MEMVTIDLGPYFSLRWRAESFFDDQVVSILSHRKTEDPMPRFDDWRKPGTKASTVSRHACKGFGDIHLLD